MDGDEENFGFFWWNEMIEEEQQEEEKSCPNCGSLRICYDENCDVWVCLDCNHE